MHQQHHISTDEDINTFYNDVDETLEKPNH